MDFMSKYCTDIDFIRKELDALPATSLYELIVRFVEKYKELKSDKSLLKEDSVETEKPKERKRGRPKKR